MRENNRMMQIWWKEKGKNVQLLIKPSTVYIIKREVSKAIDKIRSKDEGFQIVYTFRNHKMCKEINHVWE